MTIGWRGPRRRLDSARVMPRVLPLSLALGSWVAAGCGASVPMVEESAFPIWPMSDDPCVQRLAPIAHVDEPTPLGFSAVDAISHLAGSRSSPLFWLEPPDGQDYLL